MSNVGTPPIPHWRGDRDYYPKSDPRRAAHVAHIETQERLNARIIASAGDHSYSVIVAKADLP